MTSVETVDDILTDLEGTRRAEAVLAKLPMVPPRRPRVVDECGILPRRFDRPPTNPRCGAELAMRCSKVNQGRYATVLHVERTFPDSSDHGMLIIPACQILETELSNRVLQPARLIRERLVDVLRNAGDAKQATLLEKWGAGELPATIGMCCIVFLACYRAVELGDEGVTGFLQEEFCSGYLGGVRGNRLGRALDSLRNEFRNPACHGTTAFDRTGYGKFVGLLVNRPTLNEFDSAAIDSDDGLLVNHLLHHRGAYQNRIRLEEAAGGGGGTA